MSSCRCADVPPAFSSVSAHVQQLRTSAGDEEEARRQLGSWGGDQDGGIFLRRGPGGFLSGLRLFLVPGGEPREVQVSKREAKLLIQDFDPSKDYLFQILAVRGGQQSKPLQASHQGERGLEETSAPCFPVHRFPAAPSSCRYGNTDLVLTDDLLLDPSS